TRSGSGRCGSRKSRPPERGLGPGDGMPKRVAGFSHPRYGAVMTEEGFRSDEAAMEQPEAREEQPESPPPPRKTSPGADTSSSARGPRQRYLKRVVQAVYGVLLVVFVAALSIKGEAVFVVLLLLLALGIGLYLIEMFFLE